MLSGASIDTLKYKRKWSTTQKEKKRNKDYYDCIYTLQAFVSMVRS